MKFSPFTRKLFPAALAALMLSTVSVAALAAEQPVHIRGSIVDVTANGFSVQTEQGVQNVVLTSDAKIAGVVPSSLDAIVPGSFIGSANVPQAQGGAARALEVVVFPPSMKGTGLGDYDWDLPAKESGAMQGGMMKPSSMTNGTVKTSMKAMAKPSSMTNGTVKTSTGSGTRVLVVDYGKGEKTIEVPANTPVVTFQPADKSALIKGAHVFVVGMPGNPVSAGRVAVGLNGTVPPM
jgi:RNase P/RNase MRP subunit p29